MKGSLALVLCLLFASSLSSALHLGADSLRADSLRDDSLRADSLRADSLRADSLRPGSLRADSLRADSLRADSLRADSLRPDSLRADSLRADSLRADSLRADSWRADSLKADSKHKATTCTSEFSCADSSTLRICAPASDGSFTEIYEVGCAGDYPWCDPETVSCIQEEPSEYITTTTSTTTAPVTGEFTCMGNGYFPDVGNCSRYYHCVDYEPYLVECSGTTPYYAFEYETCYETEDYCANSGVYRAECDGDNPNWYKSKQQLGSLGKYFYYCYGYTPVGISRCPGAYQFNLTSEGCEARCPHAGLFPRAEDCAQYYRCSPVSGDLYETEFTMSTMLSCPEGQAFLEDAFQCVNSSLVLNCNSS